MTIGMSELIEFYKKILIKKGCTSSQAHDIAKVQVEIHGFGVITHGLRPIHVLIDDIGKTIDPQKVPKHILDNGSLQGFDCAGCLSIENIRLAAKTAGECAEKTGIGLCAVHNTGWIGALGYHLAALAGKGYLVMGWVQSSNFANTVPHSGIDARFSTNPMGYSFPQPDGKPVVADFSTSAVSNGKAYQWIGSGQKAPEKIFLDAEAVPCDDPAVLKNNGRMLPTGGVHFGYKGTLLSLWIEALVAATGIKPISKEKDGGHNAVVMAIRINAMDTNNGYDTYIKDLLDWVRSSRPAIEGSDVRISGERGWNALANARVRGIELTESHIKKIEKLTEEYNLAGLW